MASQQTPNYRLSRWAGTDRILVEEFNDNWDKIDTALKSSADGVAALQTALAGAGNCEIGMISYTGSGQYGTSSPTTVTFSKMPLVFFVKGKQSFMVAKGGESTGCVVLFEDPKMGGNVTTLALSWNGNKVTMVNEFGAKYQMNENESYWVLALCQK